MRPFAFARVNTLAEAIRAATDHDSALIAGGTELINWLKERIVAPGRVVDIKMAGPVTQIGDTHLAGACLVF